MHKSIFGSWNWNLGLFVLSSLCGYTRVASQSNQMNIPPQEIQIIQNVKSTQWGASEVFIIPERQYINYIITCSATALPPPTFEWKFKDATLSNSEYVSVFSNGTILFKQFTEREDGYYQCIARNALGVSMSKKYYIVRERLPKPNPSNGSEQVNTFTKSAGEPFNLQCEDTKPTFPEYFKRWYFKENTREVSQDDRIGTDSRGTMWFSYLLKTDATDYICGLAPQKAESGDFIQYYNMVTLKVNDNADMGQFASKIQFRSGNGKVKAFLNRNVVLECFFSGNPVANISWKDNSNKVITGGDPRFTLGAYNRRLTISDVRDEDEGTFNCIANNGNQDEFGPIYVNVTSAPLKVLGQGLINLIAPDRTDVTLRCQAKAAYRESLDTPVWYRNGQLLRSDNLPDPYRYSFNADYTQLFIRNISLTDDTACFQCNVSNSEGSTFYDGSLRVIESIVIRKQPSQVIEITENDAIDISVVATGDACCNIVKRWFLNNQSLGDVDLHILPFVQDLSTGTLLFNATDVPESVLKSRLGQYIVIVSNQYQELRVRFAISKKGALQVQAAGVEFELWWLAIILGVLAIIIAIIIIVCCVKRNYPRQTYQLEKTELKHHLNPQEDLLDQSFQEI